MTTAIQPNQWLSDFFGREIREIKVASHELEKIHYLQTQGFQFVEGELDFVLELGGICQKVNSKKAKNLPNLTACKAELDDVAALQHLFGDAFLTSRFRSPWYSVEENQRFYQTWIANAVKGIFDDCCLVLKDERRTVVAGVSLRFQGDAARVGLLAVAKNAQRKGVGSQLMQLAINEAKAQNAKRLLVATQSSNLAACGLYQSFGAKLAASHYWFYPSISADKEENDPL